MVQKLKVNKVLTT